MDYINAAISISFLLIMTYMICYFIVYIATVYDFAAKGKGSILDNPYLAKLMIFISTAIYYIIYYVFVSIQGTYNYVLRNKETSLLTFMIVLSIIICILYTKIY
jgi:hypothetical protein